jgi:hypothetical protein
MDSNKQTKKSKSVKISSTEREKIEKALKRKDAVSKSKPKNTTSDITKKVSLLKKVYRNNQEDNPDIRLDSRPNPLSGTLDDLINGMPSELIDLINDEIEFCLSRDCDPMEVNERVKNMIYLLHLAYKDPRRYLDMYGRNYQELLLSDFISEICETDYSEEDWHRIARLNFNLNGLRTINNFGVDGHSSGNRLLEQFASILKNGRTVKALESLGIRVIPSAEGSDIFGWVMYGPHDLRLILSVAEELLLQEAQEADVSHLINFNDERVQSVLKNIDGELKPEMRIMASLGSATLGEVLENIDIPRDMEYTELSKILLNNMFKAADERAKSFKEVFKRKMKEENPPLYHLYARSNIEILEERVKELEEEVQKLKKND